MTCKNCGTEIADKALICYRCGTATFEAQRKPAPVGGGGRRWPYVLTTVLLVLLVLGALGLSQFETPQTPPYARWVLAALAALVLAVRVYLRRRIR
jgi:zinc-ribbon domain